jgi:hypothetical protein
MLLTVHTINQKLLCEEKNGNQTTTNKKKQECEHGQQNQPCVYCFLIPASFFHFVDVRGLPKLGGLVDGLNGLLVVSIGLHHGWCLS